MCNLRNEAMTNPFQSIALTLSYIKGPRVDDWVAQQSNVMVWKVFGNPNANPLTVPIYHDDDERLWNKFVDDFGRVFADTMAAEQAYVDLTRLEMKSDEIDEYIATFEHLLSKAGWDRNAHGSLEMFKQGLRKGLHATILQRDPMPVTIDEWQAAARREVQRHRLIFASLGPCGGDYLSTRQNRRREALRGPPQRRSQRDPDAMDVDATSISEGDRTGWRDRGGLSETEKKKWQQEGRCFLCGRQGHMRRACPKKKDDGGKQGNESNHTERARAVTTEQRDEINQQGRNEQGGSDAPESPPAYDPDSLISHIKTMNISQRDELLDWLMEGDTGF